MWGLWFLCLVLVYSTTAGQPSDSEVYALHNGTLASLARDLDLYNPERTSEFLKQKMNEISETCYNNMEQFLRGLETEQPWAMRMLDASGSYSSGYLFGNHYWMGSQTACLDLLHPRNQQGAPPFNVIYYTTRFYIPLNISADQPIHLINLGICSPAGCSVPEMTKMLTHPSPSNVILKSVRPVPDDDYNFYLEPAGITLVSVAIFAFVMVAIGTGYDLYKEKEGSDVDQGQRNKEIVQKDRSKISTVDKLQFYVSHNAEDKDHPVYKQYTNSTNSINSSASVSSFDSTENKVGLVAQVLLCFSFKRNLKKIFDLKGSESLGCVHGLRVLSLLWVIAGHSCMITVPFVDNKRFRIVVERDFMFQSISNGAFSVDTFFFLSGLLISYVFNKSERDKNSETEETASSHAKVSLVKFVGGMTYRLIRLTPPYLVVLVLSYLTSAWFSHNSVFDPPVGDHVTCPQYWWRNLLYINTLFPVDQMCMIWSWYLADDTQFYVLGLILLLLSSRYFKFALGSSIVLLVSSFATTAVITFHTEHKPSIEEPLGLFDQLYDKPWTRLAPYLVGMAVGYYLARINCKASFHKGLVVLGWVLSMATTFVLVHGLYGDLGQLESAAYVTLSHTAWALAVSWVVVACVTGHGGPVNKILSAKVLAPLSRLTYCAYLIHPLIMLSAVAHMDGPTHLQRDTMIIAIFGYFFASYLGSIVLALVFEAPFVALLNIFHPLKRKMK